MTIASGFGPGGEMHDDRAMGREMETSGATSMKRIFLQTIIVTLALAASVGIYVFLFGRFGETEAKILGTTLTVCCFSITSLACSAAFEKKRYPFLFLPGLVLSIIGLLLYIPSIWAEWFDIQIVGKAMAIVAVLSFSFAQASLLSLATLERRFAWVFYAAQASLFSLAAILSWVILFQPDTEWIMRVVGVVAILDASFTLCVPILHRLGSKQMAEAATETYNQIELACPRCGQQGRYGIGDITCPKCSLGIRVQIGQKQC